MIPALVETALTMGNAGVTAVTQLGRAAKPVVEESAAHMHHVVRKYVNTFLPTPQSRVKSYWFMQRDIHKNKNSSILRESESRKS